MRKTKPRMDRRILETLRDDWAFAEDIAAAMTASPIMRVSGNRGSNEDFLNDVGADDIADSARKLFPHLDESEQHALAVHVLLACHQAYRAGIQRAKDAMEDAI